MILKFNNDSNKLDILNAEFHLKSVLSHTLIKNTKPLFQVNFVLHF